MVKILIRLLVLATIAGCSQIHTEHPEVPDFLALSKNKTRYKGYLQGVPMSDSSGPYIFSEYYSDTLSFRLFYLPKHQDKRTGGDSLLMAFVLPMQDPDKMEDYHDDPVTYPVQVRCYARKDKVWRYVANETVNDITGLSMFQIKYILQETGR